MTDLRPSESASYVLYIPALPKWQEAPGSALSLSSTNANAIFCRLYKTEKFSDFTIVCGPQTFRVHKAVLCAQSEYFHALPKFAVSPTQASIPPAFIVTCGSIHPHVACMLIDAASAY